MKNKTASFCKGTARMIWTAGFIVAFFLSFGAGKYSWETAINWGRFAYLLVALLMVGLLFSALGEIIRLLSAQIGLSLIANAGGTPALCADCNAVYDGNIGKCACNQAEAIAVQAEETGATNTEDKKDTEA